MWYIKGIIDVELVFEKDDYSKQECTCHMDSDYARILDKRRSTIVYVFYFVTCTGGWHCTLQASVDLSMIKAEYMALTKAVRRRFGFKA